METDLPDYPCFYSFLTLGCRLDTSCAQSAKFSNVLPSQITVMVQIYPFELETILVC